MRTMAFDFNSRRSMVVARRGMVATSNPLASQSGLAILRAGGTAADAAVAAAAVLNVTEPASTGIGGDMFALYYDAETRQVTALNGSGRAPAALTIEAANRAGFDQTTGIALTHPHAVSVPGAAAGWEDLLTQHGTMSLADVLADAIGYARDGFPVHPVFANSWRRVEPHLRRGHHTEDYLPAPEAGAIVRFPGLAATLQAVAEGGAAAFYRGSIARTIVETLEALGGVMTLDDLAAHCSTWEKPITADYRGVTVVECPPNGQGLAALQALRIAEGLDITAYPAHSPERLHLMIEAMRLAFADARQYIADHDTNRAPVEWLLSERYLSTRRVLIHPDRAMQPPTFGRPEAGSDTVYLSVVDGAGNACSFINSLYTGFGTGIVARGTGVFLQNRAALFSLDPAHPNALTPHKRPYHTIIPAMLLKGDELYASFGVMGGFMQPQGHFQMVSALIDDELNPQEALNQPRWCIEDGTSGGAVALEDGLPLATMARLAELGHTIRPVVGAGRGVFGDGQIIVRDQESGVLYGGSDPRKDGVTAGY